MTVSLAVIATLFGVASAGPTVAAAQRTPTEIANATTFDLTIENGQVRGCTVTATSGYAQVDLYVCNAARRCGDRYSRADHRDACVIEKREELARAIANQPPK